MPEFKLSEKTAATLAGAGMKSVEDLRAIGIGGLSKLPGIEEADLLEIAILLANNPANAAETVDATRPDHPTAAPVPTPAQEDPEEDEDDVAPITEEETIPPGEDFTVRLQTRHAQWLRDTAELHRDTTGHIIEQLVRRGCAEDPFKAGRRGGGTIPAEDFNGAED